MEGRELTLNIAVNLGRIGRWACEGKSNRVDQFLAETEDYIHQLSALPKSSRFQKTFDMFTEDFDRLRNNPRLDAVWAEMMFTWANILTHRAKLIS